MKYFKITEPNIAKADYISGNTLEEVKKLDIFRFVPNAVFTEITKTEYDKHLWEESIRQKAGKGQEVENAIELNDAIKEYTLGLMRDTQFLIWGNLKDMNIYPTDTSHLKRYEDNVKIWKAYRNLFKSIVKYERGIAIATNSDPTHPVSMPSKQDMANILTIIKTRDPELWIDITKLAGVEESYEPQVVIDIWEEMQKAVNSHAHPTTTTTDPLNVGELVSGGTN